MSKAKTEVETEVETEPETETDTRRSTPLAMTIPNHIPYRNLALVPMSVGYFYVVINNIESTSC